jgi:uncharacterized protein YjbI with pentapeptide repeats
MSLKNKQQLRQSIGQHYDLDELRHLVFDLSVDWDELAGDTKSARIIALLELLGRDGRIPDLMDLLRQRHPAVDWPEPDLETAIIEQVRQGATPDLSGTRLRLVVLNGVNLRGVNLRSADLRWASFYLANLYQADLRDADCRWTKFRKANLSQADFRGAKFKWTDLRLADLRGAKISVEQLQQAKLNGATLPNGRLFNPNYPLSEQLT